MDVGISLICSLHCGCTPWLYTVVVHCGCTLAVHCGCALWLYTVAVHCGCTLWLYTVAVHWLYTVDVHCGCTLWLYTVVVHCGCTLWLYTAQWSWLCTSCVKIPLHYAGYAVDLNKAACSGGICRFGRYSCRKSRPHAALQTAGYIVCNRLWAQVLQ